MRVRLAFLQRFLIRHSAAYRRRLLQRSPAVKALERSNEPLRLYTKEQIDERWQAGQVAAEQRLGHSGRSEPRPSGLPTRPGPPAPSQPRRDEGSSDG